MEIKLLKTQEDLELLVLTVTLQQGATVSTDYFYTYFKSQFVCQSKQHESSLMNCYIHLSFEMVLQLTCSI